VDLSSSISQAPGSRSLHGDAGLDVDLRPVAGVRPLSLGEDTRVDLGTETQAAPPVTPIETHPPEALVLGQFPRGDLEEPIGFVESQGSIIISE
jgi:hypothetical protein